MKKFLTNKIFIASDHAGFELKQFLINELPNLDIKVSDLGCNSATESFDYPDYAKKLVSEIKEESDFGILICGSGIGISIAANRFDHIRAALCHNTKSAKLSRAHNNSNVIVIGARFIKSKSALAMVKAFLTTKFEDGRHRKRVEKLSQK
ncbi:MAG: ribose 5-phosphate isomerase B [Pelagibacterales bacterium]|nr:ribose 5-phosphate isomerase B [Pelagibacterales bacterium]